jgi:carbon monoxide dehydrogenase subunit G
MRLESDIIIRRTPEQVWSFLGDVSNVPKWDRGVSGTRQTSSGAAGVGMEFDTFAHSKASDDNQAKGQMSYRITEVTHDRCTIQLTSSTGNARYFKTAKWQFHVEPCTEGTRLTCAADFKLRFPYVILAPVFYMMNGAIRADLENLKRVLESQ